MTFDELFKEFNAWITRMSGAPGTYRNRQDNIRYTLAHVVCLYAAHVDVRTFSVERWHEVFRLIWRTVTLAHGPSKVNMNLMSERAGFSKLLYLLTPEESIEAAQRILAPSKPMPEEMATSLAEAASKEYGL